MADATTLIEIEPSPGRILAVVRGDITRIPADAIVNAANSSLAGGGGVDGAIHRAGGPAIMDDLDARYGRGRHCPTGSAVVTTAGDLPADWIVHAVGPIWRGGGAGEAEQLASTYATSLRLADEQGAGHVTFPAISTGIYGYPSQDAAAVAVAVLVDALVGAEHVRRVTLVAYSADSAEVLRKAAAGR